MKQREFTIASVSAAIAASVGMFVGSTPMTSAVASLFIEPVTREFGLSRAAYGWIMIIPPFVCALLIPIGGRAMDRFGVRRVILPIVLGFGLTQWVLWQVSSLATYICANVLLGVFASIHTYSAYTKVVANWFGRHRGIVTGLMIALGSALGASLIPRFVRVWIESDGWRSAYFYMGCIILFYGLPILFLFLREPPAIEQRARQRGVDSTEQLPGLTRAEAVRTRTFWTLLIAIVLAPMAIVGTIAHAFPLIRAHGFSALQASNALSLIYLGGGLLGQLTSGYLLDRISSPRVALPYFGAALIGVGLVQTATTLPALYIGAVLAGCGQGSEHGICAYLTTRFFGLRAYGAIYGLLFGAANFGVVLGIVSMGQAYDLDGSYARMAYVFVPALLVVVLLLASLPRYRFERQLASP